MASELNTPHVLRVTSAARAAVCRYVGECVCLAHTARRRRHWHSLPAPSADLFRSSLGHSSASLAHIARHNIISTQTFISIGRLHLHGIAADRIARTYASYGCERLQCGANRAQSRRHFAVCAALVIATRGQCDSRYGRTLSHYVRRLAIEWRRSGEWAGAAGAAYMRRRCMFVYKHKHIHSMGQITQLARCAGGAALAGARVASRVDGRRTRRQQSRAAECDTMQPALRCHLSVFVHHSLRFKLVRLRKSAASCQ